MKKTFLGKVSYLLLAVPFLFGCNDKTPYFGEGVDSEYNRVYSNKQYKNHVTGDLDLTFSGNPLTGLDAEFYMTHDDRARITLNDIFFDEPEIVVHVTVFPDGEGGYKFGSSKTTPKGKHFSFDGSVGMDEGTPYLQLALKDVTIPANYLSSHGTFTTPTYSSNDVRVGSVNYRYHDHPVVFWATYDPDYGKFDEGWEYDEEYEGKMIFADLSRVLELLFDPDVLVYKLVSNLIYLLLEDITFNRDGTISATYCPMPEDLDILGMLFSDLDPSIRNEGLPAPENLLQYRVYDNEVVVWIDFIQLIEKLDLIGMLLPEDAPETRAKGLEGILDYLPLILQLIDIPAEYQPLIDEALPLFSDWIVNGISFKFIPNDPDRVYYTSGLILKYSHRMAGDYKFYLDEKDLGGLIRMAPKILEILDVDLNFELPISIPGLDFNKLISDIMDRLTKTQKLEIGLMLHD